MSLIRDELTAWGLDATSNASSIGVVGSSLGGFYATRVAHSIACRAVLINPAVQPWKLLAQHIGEQRSFHGDDVFFFRSEFIEELRELDTGAPCRPERLLAVIAKGDEVLDWRSMAEHYAHCHLRILDGGDHALSDYPNHLAATMAFMGLPVHEGEPIKN